MQIGADWFNPFAARLQAHCVDGILLGIFIYWGWDSGVAVNEETESSAEASWPGGGGSTLVLLGIYLVVSAGAQSFRGTGFLIEQLQRRPATCSGQHVFGRRGTSCLIIAVLTSASASTQTTILPTARTTLSMARWKAIPRSSAKSTRST